jgi:hypothetical protein
VTEFLEDGRPILEVVHKFLLMMRMTRRKFMIKCTVFLGKSIFDLNWRGGQTELFVLSNIEMMSNSL